MQTVFGADCTIVINGSFYHKRRLAAQCCTGINGQIRTNSKILNIAVYLDSNTCRDRHLFVDDKVAAIT